MQLMKDNCLFCKISRKDADAFIVFEDDVCLAILDIAPASTGHMLLLPREHYMFMPMVPDDVLGHLSSVSLMLSNLLQEAFTCKSVKTIISNGAAAGQQSQHFMLHIIPEYVDHVLSFDLEGKSTIPEAKLEELQRSLQEKLVTMNAQAN